MRFCFVHAADLHLDTPFQGIGQVAPFVAQALQDASLDAFDALVELAIERDAAFVVLAGDIYDGAERGIRPQLRFRIGLERLSEAGIWSFVAHGNHDPVATGWSAIRSDWPERVKVFEPGAVEEVVVERDGEPIATVRGISFAQREEMENLALRFPNGSGSGLQVGVLHCNVGGITEHDPYAPCTVDDLVKAGYDYWALGHIHQRQFVKEGNPWIVYPGNLQGRSPKPSEQGEKGAFVVQVDGRNVHPPEFVALDTIRFERLAVDIAEIEDLPNLERILIDGAGRLQSHLEGRSLLVRAVLSGRGPLHADLIREGAVGQLLQALRDESGEGKPFLWWEAIHDATEADLDLDAIGKRGDFSSELLTLGGELLADETLRRSFVGQHLADLRAGELEGMEVDVPDGLDPDRWNNAIRTALGLLAGEQR